MPQSEAVARCLNSLRSGDVRKAVEISSHHFGGSGTLYEKETISIVESILTNDYTPDPTLKEKVLQPLRVVAAALDLWGETDLTELAEVSGNWTYRLKPKEVIRLLYAAGLASHRLERLRESRISIIELRSPADRPPEPCRADLGRAFPIREVPVLPHGDPGCRCCYIGARAARELAPV